jgi:transposase
MEVKKLGIDLSKDCFVLCGVDERGKVVLKKQLNRNQLKLFLANLKPCEIGMESGSGCHYWARLSLKYGHTAKIIAAQHVTPFRKSGKNDANDAEAIVEAMSRPTMRFVAVKQPANLDLQIIHRVRERLVQSKVALCNQIRGYLTEYGMALTKSPSYLKKMLPKIIDDVDNELTPMARATLRKLYDELDRTISKVTECDGELEAIAKSDERCKRIMKIEGIGPITATAIIASVANFNEFKSGRQFSAWLGLTPRQHSTGGKTRLGSISKRGDGYLRMLLVHGARSTIVAAKKMNKTDRRSKWVLELREKKGYAKTAVAFANKNARVIWAVLTKEVEYKVAA